MGLHYFYFTLTVGAIGLKICMQVIGVRIKKNPKSYTLTSIISVQLQWRVGAISTTGIPAEGLF